MIRRFLFVIALLACTACGTIPANVKIFQIYPEHGLVRRQDKESPVLPFAKAKGYLCTSPKDFENTAGCVGGGVKIYYLDPARGGLYRKQARELLTYAQAAGYFCTSPKDFTTLLDQCASPKEGK